MTFFRIYAKEVRGIAALFDAHHLVGVTFVSQRKDEIPIEYREDKQNLEKIIHILKIKNFPINDVENA